MKAKRRADDLYHLKSPFTHPMGHKAFSLVSGALEQVLALDQVNQLYFQAAAAPADIPFTRRVLDVLKVTYAVSETERTRIPVTGPAVVVANHPFGGLESLILADLLRAVRPDVKFLANFMLENVPDVRDLCIYVDPFGGPKAKQVNLRPLRESLSWLKQGGLLVVFPAGTVSHMDLKRGGVVDPEWSTSVARLVEKAACPTVPVYFKGANGLTFQLLGLLHPRVRTALLPRELLNKKSKTITVRVGQPVPFKKLAELPDDVARTQYLRARCYRLSLRRATEKAKTRRRFPLVVRAVDPGLVPVVDPGPVDALQAEVDRIPPDHILVRDGTTVVFHTTAQAGPHLLREIGRLRELTFREVGEGSGKAIDLDVFDDYYIHLVMWNTERKEIMGAYRLGQTDQILDRLGKRGLYSSTLFKYRKTLLKQISPALEMGRSFIRKEYQRSFSSLLLLWKGIARYVVAHPEYKILFGPVSINNEYQSVSRQMLVAYLKMANYEKDMARLVKPRKPLRKDLLAAWMVRRSGVVVKKLEDIDGLIADIENDLKGMPVLLRQYLKLGGRLLAFNVDPKFSYVVDGLILVDLRQTDPTILARFMGKDGAASFLAHHAA